MKSPFNPEPLKDLISKISPRIKKESHEHVLFVYLIALFFIGSLITIGPGFIGMVAQGSGAATLSINETYLNSQNVSLELTGNVTSIRLTGTLLGNGTAKIYVGNRLVIDTSAIEKKSGNLITGFVALEEFANGTITGEELIVPNETQEDNITATQEDQIEAIEGIINTTYMAQKNATVDVPFENNITLGSSLNATKDDAIGYISNETADINQSEDGSNIEINYTVEQNISVILQDETIQDENETFELISNDTAIDNATTAENMTLQIENLTLPVKNITLVDNMTLIDNLNLSDNITLIIVENKTLNLTRNLTDEIFISKKYFEDYCLETCSLSGLGKNITLRIVVEDSALNLLSITYTYKEEAENISIPVMMNESINATFATAIIISENYSYVEINKPVEWIRIIDTKESNKTLVPIEAFNITADRKARVIIEESKYELDDYNDLALSRELEREVRRLQKPVHEKDALKTYEYIKSLNKKILSLNTQDRITTVQENVTLEFEQSNGTIELRYYTHGPSIDENEFGKYNKKITVSSTKHYENVLTYTDITESRKDAIKVYWLINDSKTLFTDVEYLDTNNDGMIDRLQWITPHLSNQTFEISITVLNPYEYLRDGDTWIVAFNTTGSGNLTISSPNAGWTEFLGDNTETFDEMKFLTVKCDEDYLMSELKLIDSENNVYNYSGLSSNDSIDIQRLFINDYECNSTGYIFNYMLKGGYATLLFNFSNQYASVSDYAYDPDQYTVDYLTFADTTRNKAYLNSSATNMVTTQSLYSNFTSSTNPSGAEGWGGYEATSTGYTALANNDGSFLNVTIFNASGSMEPYATFNFTISSPPSLISWINVEMDQKSGASSESCYYMIFNYTKNDWVTFGTSIVPANGEVLRTFNYTADVGSLLNLTHQLVIMSYGASMESSDACLVDYVAVRVGYTNNSIPTHSTPTLTPSVPNVTSTLTCGWNSISDLDGDSVTNITLWYKNNKSITNLYMPFEGNGLESKTTLDYSGLKNSGKVISATWNMTGGKVGGGYYFDGVNDIVEIQGKSYFDKPPFTVMGWFNSKLTSASKGESMYIMDKRGAATDIWHFRITSTSNNLEFRYQNTTGYLSGVSTSYSIVPHAWYHFAATVDTDYTVRLYANGTYIGSYNKGPFAESRNVLRIGGASASSNRFNGTIDEIKVYNSTLSAGQIYQEYLAGAAGNNNKKLSNEELVGGDEWYCSVIPNDGYNDGTAKNSSHVVVAINNPPVWVDDPVISPRIPIDSSNLTCLFNISEDGYGTGSNITNWYKNGKSITLLYLPFESNGGNEDSNTGDYSGYGNNATVYGAQWSSTSGKLGGGYDVLKDAGDYLAVSDSPTLRGMSKLTIEVWTYVYSKANWAVLLEKGSTAAGWRDIAYSLETDASADQKVYFYLNTTTKSADIYSDSALPKNQWTHIVARYDGSEISLFVNGQKQTSSEGIDGNVLSMSNPLHIGVNSYISWNDYWNGTIDEIRFYNDSLSDRQIYLNYIRGTNGKAIQISRNETSLWDEWFCRVTPTDETTYGITKNSSISTITINGNYRPTAPTSLLCDGGLCNYTTSGNVILNCTGSLDNESDAMTYVIEKGNLISNDIFFEDVESMSWSDWNASWGRYDDLATDSPKVFWQDSTYGGAGYYHSATKSFWIDNEDDDYQGYLVSPNITIPDFTENLTLKFWIRVNTEAIYDGCWAEYRIGDNNWTLIDSNMIEGTANDYGDRCDGPSLQHVCWEGNLGLFEVNVSLPSTANGKDISFRWVSEADGSGTAGGTDGCWVDDINVTADLAYSFTVIGNHTAGNTYSWNTGLDTPGEVYEKMRCSAVDVTGSTANSEYYTLDTNITIGGNVAPTINTPAFLPNTVNTSSNIQCYATPDDTESSTVTVEWYWYNSSDFKFGGNLSGLTAGSPALITTLGSGNTTKDDVWNCTVRTYDGSQYSSFKSVTKTVGNIAPTHSAPSVTPVSPFTTDNLVCSWNGASDIDNDKIINITNWYKNNRSITQLYMPFEGNGNEANEAADYSGYENNGTVYGADWSKTSGKIGGGYSFNSDNSDYISVADSSSLGNIYSISMWVYPQSNAAINGYTVAFISKYTSANDTFRLGYEADSSNVAYGTAIKNGVEIGRYANTPLQNDRWYHIAYVLTSPMKIYVNGVDDTSGSSNTWGRDTHTYLMIGGRSTTTGLYNGSIDEIKIFNFTLSGNQIYQEYLAGYYNHTNKVIAYSELSGNDEWLCSVTPNDGDNNGITKNSTSVTISPNSAPTQNTPTVTPNYPNMTTNITCSWNNITDVNGNSVINLTNWYRNNNSITVLYMPFESNGNEDKNTTDYSGNNNNGTIFSASWNRTGGIIGGAYKYNGDSSYIEIPDDATLRGMSELTVETWVYTATNFSYYPRIIEKGSNSVGDTNISYAIRIVSGTQEIQFDLTTDSGGGNTYSNSALPRNQWVHIVGRYNGALANLFINGVKQADSTSFSGKVLNVSGTPIHIGVDAYKSWNDYWNGSIDEVKIYNIALSDQQIYANYIAGSNNKVQNIIVSNDLTSGDYWQCSVTPHDGYTYGITKNSTRVRINSLPTHDSPTITPSSPKLNNNLTCNWNNVADINHDAVVNITNWYKDNRSVTLLYLPFEGNGNEENNATDYSGYGHNGTVILADWNRTGGRIGGAYKFDSALSNYISVEDDGTFGGMNQLTVEAWIYANSKSNWRRIIEKANTVQNKDRAFVIEFDSAADQRIYMDLNTTAGFPSIYSDGPVPKHQWVHIVLRYDGETLKMFINGDEQSDFDYLTGNVLNLQNPIHIGSGAYYDGNSFNGTIDEVRIYNHSLSAQQIRANYQAGLNGKNLKRIIASELGREEEWLCSVTPNDGYENGATKNSTSVYLSNTAPTQNSPTISPASPISTSNLTCNWQSVSDAEGDKTYNITTWKKNNHSMMLAYLPFEGGSNETYTKDYSGLNNDVNVSSALYGRSIGKVGGGYEFDGIDDIIRISSNYDLIGPFTLMAWIKPKGKQENYTKIITQRNSGDTTYVASLQYDHSKILFFAHGSGDIFSIFNLTNNTWFHLVGTYEDGITKLYINGVLHNSSFVAPYYPSSTAAITVGARYAYGDVDHEFNGTIDEVKIYNYSLTSTQIYDEYLAGLNNITYNKLLAASIDGNEQWTCFVTPNDGYIDGAIKNASVIIQNSPTTPTTIVCDGGSCSNTFSNSVILNCSGSTDYLGDNIVYVVEKGNASVYNATVAFNRQITSGNDDAEENEPGPHTVDLTSTDLEIGIDAGRQMIGMRFPTVNIPQGAEILYANVTLEVDVATWTGSFNVNVMGEDTNTAPAFSASSGNLTNREKTTSKINWPISAQFTPVDAKYATPDIKDIIQEIVDRSGWASGNSIAIFIGESNSSNELREMEAYNGENAAAPILYIKYKKFDYTVLGNHTKDTTLSWNLGSEVTGETFERLRCRAIDMDGSAAYSSYYNLNTSFIIGSFNRVPTHDVPTITPALPNITSNLTCNWNNIADLDGDAVQNITNWYKNNRSITVLYMPFEGNGNEAKNATDYSGYENNGTVFGAAWSLTNGKVGGGYYFDGTDQIIIDNSPSLNITGAFTIEAWIKEEDNTSVSILSKFNRATNNRSFQLYIDSTSDLSLYVSNDGTTEVTVDAIAGYEFNDDNWHHVVGKYNGSVISIYKDGVLVNSKAYSNGIAVTNQNILIGNAIFAGPTNKYFRGYIDEVKIYNYSLSAGQIYQNYKAGLNNKTANIVTLESTALDEQWICSVTPNDGYQDGTTKNSTTVTIQNLAPTHDAPTITPALPNITSNLTCNWNNVFDLEGDSVVNITNWYRNNKSITLLYMPFEGNGNEENNATDYSSNNLIGTVSGGATWNRTGGKIGGAYEFDGVSSYIYLPDSEFIDINQSATWMGWIYLNQLPTTAGHTYRIMDKWIGTGNQRSYQMHVSGTTNKITINLDPDGLGLNDVALATDSAISANRWYHFAYVFNGTKLVMYLNGVLQSGSAAIDSVYESTAPLTIGTDNSPYTTNPFNGSMDEIKIFNISLSSNQIRTIFEQENRSMNSRTIFFNETALNDEWICSVTPNDGYQDGTTKNSTAVTIQNLAPTHDAPTITPALPNITSNLTCNWNNVVDLDGDAVQNITNWYKNNRSITVLYMPFEGNGNEAKNATDYSGYGNNGTVAGPDWNRTGGKVGGAYTFNGWEDDIRISHSSELSLNNSFTLEAWVYPRKWGNDGTIIRKDAAVNSNYALMINNGNSWSFYVYGLTTNHVERPVTGYGLNRWYHVVAVYNETDLLLYVNGTLIGNESTSGIPNTTTGELRIGQEYGGTDEFNGSIDEVRIYNISLSPSQIWANYQAGLAGNTPSIIVSSETSLNDEWLCSVTPNDGYIDGTTKNSTAVTIQNLAPTHDAPYITPSSPNITSNLTCNWNNVVDLDGDAVQNITNWYKNNRSITVLYMPFEGNGNEANNATDYSGYENVGTVHGAIWNRTGGKVGGAYEFDGGNDYIGVGDIFDDGYTLSAWIKTTDNLITIMGLSNTNAIPSIQIQSNKLLSYQALNNYKYGSSILNDDKWHHIVVVYNESNASNTILYVDGFEEGIGPKIYTTTTNSISDVKIGVANTLYYYNGSIDEVKIYNFSLTRGQIRNIFNQENRSINAHTIIFNETSLNDEWFCSVTPNDGYIDGITKNSTSVIIQNLAPTHDTPFITPALPNTTSNLTCNWNNVVDLDGDSVVNITNWYRNNKSITLLYMPFEGNGNEENNATDYSGYGHNGTVHGATWNRTGGKFGGGYSFDGSNDYIFINKSGNFEVGENFSIEFWMKSRENLTTSTPYILDKDSSTDNIGWQVRFVSNGRMQLDLDNNTQSATEQLAAVVFYPNSWYHIVLNVNMKSGFLYWFVNGTLRETDTYSTITGLPSGLAGLAVGSTNGGLASHFNGTLDGIKLYNFTLSASQIYQNYISGYSGKESDKLVFSETSISDEWFCSVTPNDGYIDGTTKNSTSVTILASNTAPTRVNLTTPTQGNITVHKRNTIFAWDAAYDSDSDPLNYTINITSSYCSDMYIGNISALTYTTTSELCLDSIYYWQVRAYDGAEYGQWSQKWNFTIEPVIILNLTIDTINFGNLSRNSIADTDNNASPLIVQNDGNMVMNISYISAIDSLFSSIGLNTVYFQFKVDNDTTESSSFNWTASQTSWTNITSMAVQNKSAIGYLNYQESNDNAEIDIRVVVPDAETPGSKSTLVYIIGESP